MISAQWLFSVNINHNVLGEEESSSMNSRAATVDSEGYSTGPVDSRIAIVDSEGCSVRLVDSLYYSIN